MIPIETIKSTLNSKHAHKRFTTYSSPGPGEEPIFESPFKQIQVGVIQNTMGDTVPKDKDCNSIFVYECSFGHWL